MKHTERHSYPLPTIHTLGSLYVIWRIRTLPLLDKEVKYHVLRRNKDPDKFDGRSTDRFCLWFSPQSL